MLASSGSSPSACHVMPVVLRWPGCWDGPERNAVECFRRVNRRVRRASGGGGPEFTASGAPRETFRSGNRAFPPISAPARPPRPACSPSGITPWEEEVGEASILHKQSGCAAASSFLAGRCGGFFFRLGRRQARSGGEGACSREEAKARRCAPIMPCSILSRQTLFLEGENGGRGARAGGRDLGKSQVPGLEHLLRHP